MQLASSFLSKYPDLFKWFKDFVGHKDGGGPGHHLSLDHHSALPPQQMPGRERMSGDSAMEIGKILEFFSFLFFA